MKQKYFISLKQVNQMVKHYGGFRKWMINDHIDSRGTGCVYCCEKGNYKHWLLIQRDARSDQLMITFSDDTGWIIKRSYWDIINNDCVFIREEDTPPRRK